jgi:aldose 1-epimerase
LYSRALFKNFASGGDTCIYYHFENIFIILCVMQDLKNTNTQQINKPIFFGLTPAGEKVMKYTLSNARGTVIEIINYGAIIKQIRIPDKHGTYENIILGFDDLDSYIHDTTYQGAIVGPFANRIHNGSLRIDGNIFYLEKNEANNHLHGGTHGFSKHVWKEEGLEYNSVRFSLLHPDGLDGYPGNIFIEVQYSLNDENEFMINYSGHTDAVSILNPTSHCYFNLTGNNKNSILDHELMISADHFIPIGKNSIPLGEIRSLSQTAFDFRSLKRIGKDIASGSEQLCTANGYDHYWVLKGFNGEMRLAAQLVDPKSRRVLKLFTNQTGLQFYSGNFLENTQNIKFKNRSGVCLEAQGFPDSPNHDNFPTVTLYPHMHYRQTSIYAFSILRD